MNQSCSHQIMQASRKFFNTQYWPIVEAATALYVKGDFNKVLTELQTLPSDKDLLAGLIEKVKGKPVYSNLKKIFKGESVDRLDMKIALSSLYTRCCIEQKDFPEFRCIESELLNKLKELSK